MARTSNKRTEIQPVSVRLSPDEKAKLERLAQATGRYPSQVLRFLVQTAELSGHPDIKSEVVR